MAMLGESIDPRLLRLDPQVFKSIENAGAASGAMYASLGASAGMTIEKIQQNQRDKEDFAALEASGGALGQMLNLSEEETAQFVTPIIQNYRNNIPAGQKLLNSFILQEQLGAQKINQIGATGEEQRANSTLVAGLSAKEAEEARKFTSSFEESKQRFEAEENKLEREFRTNLSKEEWNAKSDEFKKERDLRRDLFDKETELKKWSLNTAATNVEKLRKNEYIHEKDILETTYKLKGESERSLVFLTHGLSLASDEAQRQGKLNYAKAYALQAQDINNILVERNAESFSKLMKEAREIGLGTKALFQMTQEDIDKENALTLKIEEAGFVVPDFRNSVSSAEELEERLGNTWTSDNISSDFINMIEPEKRTILAGQQGARIYGHYILAVNNLLDPSKTKGKPEGWSRQDVINYNKEMRKGIEEKLGLTVGSAQSAGRFVGMLARQAMGLSPVGLFQGAESAYDRMARMETFQRGTSDFQSGDVFGENQKVRTIQGDSIPPSGVTSDEQSMFSRYRENFNEDPLLKRTQDNIRSKF